MADRAISALPTATVLTATDLFVLSQSNQAKNTTWQTIIGYLATALDGHGGIKTISYAPPVAPSLDGTLSITLADDTVETFTVSNGNGVASVTQYWAVSSSDSSTPSTWYTTMQTMTPTDKYLWSYISFEMDDETTLDTTPSVTGVYGDTGQNWYVWIKYAGQEPTSDADMGDTPDNWFGIYSGTSSTAPAHYTDYDWFEIKGDKGDTGDSISAVTKTSGTGAPGTTDVYTVYVNGVSVGTFNVYQGSDGEGAPGSATPLADSGTGVVGGSDSFAREDHQHPLNVATSGTPEMDGTASLGSAATYARTDHVHPSDTSKQDALVSGTNIKTVGGQSLLGSGDVAQNYVNYASAQTLTTSQKKQARDNIGADWIPLWQNASPTSNFAAQTIPFDYSGYDFLAIVIQNRTDQPPAQTIIFEAKNGGGFAASKSTLITNGMYFQYRQGDLTASGISISDALEGSVRSGGNTYPTAQNAVLIPYYIYGLKVL